MAGMLGHLHHLDQRDLPAVLQGGCAPIRCPFVSSQEGKNQYFLRCIMLLQGRCGCPSMTL